MSRQKTISKWLLHGSALYTSVFAFGMVVWKAKPKVVYPEGVPNIWQKIGSDTFDFVAEWGWIGVPIASLLGVLAKWLEKRSAECPLLKAIEMSLQHFHAEVQPEKAHNNNFRITLFRYRKYSWWEKRRVANKGWDGCLEVALRSGFFRKSSSYKWKISESHPNRNEGVAGEVYATGMTKILEGLMSKTELMGGRRRGNRKAYANDTNCPLNLLEEKLRSQDWEPPRSFWGTPVAVDGLPWGVLLIDSTLPSIGGERAFSQQSAMLLKVCDSLLTNKQNHDRNLV